MKVAFLLAGHLRTFYRCLETWQTTLFDKYDVDIFLHTWDKSGLRLDYREDPNPGYHTCREDLSLFSFDEKFKEATKNFKAVVIDSHDEFYNRFLAEGRKAINAAPPSIRVVYLYSQWYKVQKAFELAEQTNKYDVVIRCRPDVAIFKMPDFKYLVPGTIWIPVYPTYLGHPPEQQQTEDMHDILGVGNQIDMKKYCSLYSNMDNLWEFAERKRPVHTYIGLEHYHASYFYNPHLLLRGHFTLTGLRSFADVEIKYEIVR